MKDLVKALQDIHCLSALPAEAFPAIARFTSLRAVRTGETVFCQGEPSPYCFGVLSGEVVIQRASSDRRFPMKLLGVVGPGGLFGESSLFEESPRAAMASASKDGELLVIRGSEFRDWIGRHPGLAQPVLLSLLQVSSGRLHRTSHELSVVYGVGRLLGSGKPYREQLGAMFDFLKSSLEGVDDLALYQRSPYWEEFEPVLTLPAHVDLPAVAADNELIQKVSRSSSLYVFDPRSGHRPLEAFRLDWQGRMAVVMIPLWDWERPAAPLQGLLMMASATRPNAFSTERQLMLGALAQPLAEALARQARLQDAEAQSRMARSRQSIQGL